MARTFPGGNTVDRVFPPTLLERADPSWKEEYVADLTGLGTASYAHDATVSINGVTWKSETDPVAGGDPEGTINSDGNGLTILSDGDSVDNIVTGITCPTFSFKLLDAIQMLFAKNWCVPDGSGSWSGGYDSVWWGCGGAKGASSGTDGGGTIDTDTASGIVNARNIAMETLFSFNGQTGVVGHTVSTSTSLTPFTSFGKNRRYVSTDVLASVVGASQAWVKATSETVSTLNATNPPTWSLQASTARFGIGVFTADDNDEDNFSARFTRVRVLRLGGSGGGAV